MTSKFELRSEITKPEFLGGADFSLCKKYRYRLWRQWEEGGDRVVFIGLNPSTATASTNDPTIRRCIHFAKDWGYSGLWMLNLFALRSTDPSELYKCDDPVGPENDTWTLRTAWDEAVKEIVLCWGNHGKLKGRGRVAYNIARSVTGDKMRWFGLTGEKQPKHPLYLPKSARLEVGR